MKISKELPSKAETDKINFKKEHDSIAICL
jgi:hypothetical protein